MVKRTVNDSMRSMSACQRSVEIAVRKDPAEMQPRVGGVVIAKNVFSTVIGRTNLLDLFLSVWTLFSDFHETLLPSSEADGS